MTEENERLSKEYYMELRETYKQIEITAHDVKHHLNYIEAAPNIESIRRYIRELNGRSFSRVLQFTGNFDIDVVLNAKNNEICSKGIELSINTLLKPKIEWLDSVDISIILGNGISNAIEACERYGSKEISISFQYEDDWLMISIKNATGELPNHKKAGFGLMSSKQEANHGIGMESMAATADRYDGTIKYCIKDDYFYLDILLQKKYGREFNTKKH